MSEDIIRSTITNVEPNFVPGPRMFVGSTGTTTFRRSGGGYEEFFGGQVVCPTCNGAGRIPRGKLFHQLITQETTPSNLIETQLPVFMLRALAHSQVHRKMIAELYKACLNENPPRCVRVALNTRIEITECNLRRLLYVLLAIVLCSIIGGLLLFFFFPRSVNLNNVQPTLSPTYIYSNLTEGMLLMTVVNEYNITNHNYFDVAVTALDVTMNYGKRIIGQDVNTSRLIIPLRSSIPHYIKMNASFTFDEEFIVQACSSLPHMVVLIPFQLVTLSIVHVWIGLMSTRFSKNCDFMHDAFCQ